MEKIQLEIRDAEGGADIYIKSKYEKAIH